MTTLELLGLGVIRKASITKFQSPAAFDSSDRHRQSVQYSRLTHDPQQSPSSKLHAALLVASSQKPFPLLESCKHTVVEKITELVISVDGFIDEVTSLLPSIMVILVVEVPIKMFSKIQPCFGSLPFFPLWAIHTGLPIFCTKKLELSGPT